MADEITPQARARYVRALKADQEYMTTLSVAWLALTMRGRGERLPANLRDMPDLDRDRLVRDLDPKEAADQAGRLRTELDAITSTLPHRRWSEGDDEGVEMSDDPADGLRADCLPAMQDATRQRLTGRPLFGELRRYRAPLKPG